MSAKFAGIVKAAACLAISCSVCPDALALNFHLDQMTVQEDGLPQTRNFFMNTAGERINIDIPRTWKTTSDEQSIITNPPDSSTSQIEIRKFPTPAATPLKNQGLEVYRRAAQATIPHDATGVKALKENDSPLPVFNWVEYEFQFEYDLFGRIYRRSVMFININAREQIVVTTIAAKEDFDSMRAQAMDVMRSWYSLSKMP